MNESVRECTEEYSVWNDPTAPAFQNLSSFDRWLIDEPVRTFPFKSMAMRWIKDHPRAEKYGNFFVKTCTVTYSDYTTLSYEELWTTD